MGNASSYPQRRHPRLQGFDYGSDGAYFVTICTAGKRLTLGQIHGGRCGLTRIGTIVEAEWLRTPQLRPNVTLDVHVIMPNHIHGILFIRDVRDESVARRAVRAADEAWDIRRVPDTSQTVGAIVRGFKAVTTSRCKKAGLAAESIWHGQFHDHVIRNQADLDRIREYIVTNPLRWELDCFFQMG